MADIRADCAENAFDEAMVRLELARDLAMLLHTRETNAQSGYSEVSAREHHAPKAWRAGVESHSSGERSKYAARCSATP